MATVVAVVVLSSLTAAPGRGADPAPAAAELRRRVLAALHGSSASTTGAVVAAEGLGPVLDVNGTLPLPPASTQKVYTGAAALLQFGPHHRLRTEARATGVILPDGTLSGDLVLVAGGDPSLDGDDLQRLAFDLAGKGLRRVGGWLYADDTRYDRHRAAPGWKPSFVGDEVGPLSALVVDRNRWRRDRAYLAEPVLPNLGRFRVALERAGISIAGPDALGPAPAGPGLVLATHESPPLGALVGWMLKSSDNLVAELLLKELGTTVGSGSTAAGLEVVARLGARMGMERGGGADGSGLSSHNRATPYHEVGWLLRLSSTPVADHVRLSLPLACGDGTLQQRFCGTPAAGRVFAKTGTLSGVITLAGYAVTEGGRRAWFSFELAGVRSSSHARAAIDRAVVALVSFAG